MNGFVMKAVLCFFVALLGSSYVYASGTGKHAHGHHAVEKGSDGEVVTYKDTKDGVDAYLQLCDFKDLTSRSDKGFLVKCHAKAYLSDSETGDSLQPSKLILRATIGHDKFGEALVFSPVDDNKMQTELFVKKKGKHHYLLIAEIEGLGVKEFHFHHEF